MSVSMNAGRLVRICLIQPSVSAPPRTLRHLGSPLTGNFPQVNSGGGTQTYLCLCPHSASVSADSSTHTAASDIKPGPDVGIALHSFHS